MPKRTPRPLRLQAVLAAAVAALVATPAVARAADEGGVATFVGDVIENATYEVEAVLTAFPRAADGAEEKEIEDQPVEAWTHLAMDSSTFVGDDWSFGLGLDAVASTYRGAERGAFSPPGTRSGSGHFIDLSRLTVTYLGDVLEVLVGKDDIPFGVAELYSPTDLYGRQNLANPQNEVDYGVWQLRGDLYLGSDRLTGILLPVQEAAPGPAVHSRWSGGGGAGSSDFASLTIPGLPPGVTADIRDDLRGSHPTEWGYLAQYKGMGRGVDYFVSAYNGPGPFPVLKRPSLGRVNPYDKVYPRVTIASAGVAVTEGAWKVYGEGLGYLAASDRDEDLSRVLLGAKYRETKVANRLGWDEITPIVEFAKEWRHDQQTHPSYTVSSLEARPNRNNLLLSLTVKIDSEWKIGGGHNRSLGDRDALTTVFIRYQPNDNLWVALTGTEYHGRDDTMFGRYSRNDSIGLQTSYKF